MTITYESQRFRDPRAIPLNEYKKQALKNPQFKKEYEKYDLAFEVGQMVLNARLSSGMTQKEVARALGTKQPSMARMEKGEKLPSLRLLNEVMEALGYQINISFTPKK